MILGTKKLLLEHVIEILLEKSATAADLESYLKERRVFATVQGIYKALRELIAEDVVVKQKKLYLVSNVWRRKMSALVSSREAFSLAPGEQATYRFNKIDHTDAFWKHTFADIEKESGMIPVFHFLPHAFWPYVPGRRESEYEYFESFQVFKRHGYTVIGGTTDGDQIMRKSLRNSFHETYLESSPSHNRRDHIAIIGRYIITTRISIPLAKKIDRIYDSFHGRNEQDIDDKLHEAFHDSGTTVLLVENDETKAKRLRKQLSKNFHVPAALRKEYDLF